MPIYEFVCQSCQKRATLLFKSFDADINPACPNCHNLNMSRTVSAFAYHKSFQTFNDEGEQPSMHNSPDYYKDPRNIGRWAEQRFQNMGIEMPQQVQEKIQAAREGVMPEPLKDLQSATPDATYH